MQVTPKPPTLARPVLAPGLFLAVLVLFACSRPAREQEPPLARVESRTVTSSELKQGSRLNYLSLGEAAERWIDEQVLLNYAQTSDLVDRHLLARRLQDHQQQLLAALLLDSLLLDAIHIDPERVREYYANNPVEFRFPEAAALIVHLGFVHSEDARAALGRLRASTDRDSVLAAYNFDRQLVVHRRLIPALDQAIFAAPGDDVIGPIVSDFGYHLILVERRFRKEEAVPFTFVRRNIYERLFQLQLPLARSSILDSLRETLDVEVYRD